MPGTLPNDLQKVNLSNTSLVKVRLLSTFLKVINLRIGRCHLTNIQLEKIWNNQMNLKRKHAHKLEDMHNLIS